MRESTVENNLRNRIEEKGGIAYKFVSPNNRGVPDRLVLMPIPEPLQELISRYFYFVECKAPGKKLRADQRRVHNYLRGLGYKIVVINTKKENNHGSTT